MRVFDVYLSNAAVGRLSDYEDGRIEFRFLQSYKDLTNRPVLSQYFEDDLDRTYTGPRGVGLPAFFANLVPEGPLRGFLERVLAVPADDGLGLLAAVGDDLPGAVRIQPGNPEESLEGVRADELGEGATPDADGPELKFSLAGVQLKFSMLNDPDRLTLPARGSRGDWIVKLPSQRFPYLVQNEYATMSWARLLGFDVPECEIKPKEALPRSLARLVSGGQSVLAVRRFDRDGGNCVHQEDLAQATNTHPDKRYDFSYEKCAALISAVCGRHALGEFVRRLLFCIFSGNADAHLKNWSLLYRDETEPQLSPIYDQVATHAWPETHPSKLALSFVKLRRMTDMSDDTVRVFARKCGYDEQQIIGVADELIGLGVKMWVDGGIRALYHPEQASLIEELWQSVPLIRRRCAQ